MNINKQLTTKQSIIFVIVITIALFISMQAVKAYGQEVNNNNGTNTTNSVDIESNCWETIESQKILGDYEGWSRCVL
jgi:hypothetical protein